MRGWFLGLALLALPYGATAADVAASPPQSLSVTVYRDPDRATGSIDLSQLGGFALVTETRTVHLPAGESRLRFEGVVDGIQPVSAIITGLPDGVIEKNRDAAVLSPSTLMQAAIGSDITLVRTNPKTGKVTRTSATIHSASYEGVVFQTAAGVESLRCSGLPETFQFERAPDGLSAVPTLSALTRTDHEVTATVRLSYLAEDFDWAANYVARINPGGRTLNLGAWITLANGNSVSLADAQTQIVAGRLNRVDSPNVEPWYQPRVIARCWPQGSTSDTPKDRRLDLPSGDSGSYGGGADEVAEVVVTAERRSETLQKVPVAINALAAPAPPEQLGDLKLYRVPQATTIAAMQSKQVRLLEQADVAFTRLCLIDLPASGVLESAPASVILRTKNTLANGLGLPLPSGGVAVFDRDADRDMLIGNVGLRDYAVGEDIDLTIGDAPDVQVSQTEVERTPSSFLQRAHSIDEVDITNARAAPVAFELRLQIGGTARVSNANQPMAMKDGRPIFRLTVPANGSVKVRYRVEG